MEAVAVRSRTRRRRGVLLAAIASAAMVSMPGPFVADELLLAAPNKDKPAFGIDDKDVLLYLEAVSQIREKSVRLSPEVTRARIIERSLRAYLSQSDVCCDYLTKDEYRRFKESLNERYVGVGMEIKQDRDARVVCVPHPEGPAARAGIAVGDRLRRIDEVSVDGKSVFAVAAMARGKPGTEVSFVVVTAGGNERLVRVTRSPVALPSVSKRIIDGKPVLEVVHFTRDTGPRMKDIVKGWERDEPIIVDLRGNGGGDIHAAIDSARLFLPEGKTIVSVETRKGANRYEARATAVNVTTPVYIWQDEGTASAAEVFIGALTDNERGVSIGRRSAGEAVWEEIIELSDGSALVLATGNLQTPRGMRFQGKGLTPTYGLKDGVVDKMDYLMKVRELLAARKTGRRRGEQRATG
jgi:carboxyl-terminal processing protease